MGPALCLLSAACFGAMAVFGKLAYDEGVSPQALVLLRFILAAALLGLLLLLRPGARDGVEQGEAGAVARGGSRRRPLLVALGLGAIGYATQASFFFAALERIDAPLVVLVLYTFPVMVTVAAVLLGREQLTAAKLAALVTASCGTLLVLVGAGGLGFDWLGVALAFGAAVAYTLYILVADTTVQRVPPLLLATLVMAGAATTLSLRALLSGGISLDFGLAGWFWIACIAVVSTVVSMLAFFAGLKRTGPSTASILSTFEPVTTTVLAAVVLDEFLTPVQLGGAALVLASVAVVQLRPRRRHGEDGTAGRFEPHVRVREARTEEAS